MQKPPLDADAIFRDVDSTVREAFRQISNRYKDDPEAATMAVCSVMPVLCAAIEEMGRQIPLPLRNNWIEHLHRSADRLEREPSDAS